MKKALLDGVLSFSQTLVNKGFFQWGTGDPNPGQLNYK